MNVKKEALCRLCLKVAESGFEIINDNTRNKLEYILRVNLDISKDPIICKECAEVTEKCFHFKSVCNNKEELLFAIDKNGVTFESKDIYKDDKDLEAVDNSFICQFCSNYLSGTKSALDTLMNDVAFVEILQVLMPKADLNIIKNFALCTFCCQDLECFTKFVNTCMIVEEKITSYIQTEGTTSPAQIELNEVLHYSLKNSPEFDYKIFSPIKQEYALEDIGDTHVEVVCDGKLIKSEEAIHIKDEEFNFNKTVSSGTGLGNIYHTKYTGDVLKKQNNHNMLNAKNILEAQIFKCTICTYQTNQKDDLKMHESSHKDSTNVIMYKCSLCTHETKYKRALKGHMLVHKNLTELEMYKCSMCTYETKHKRGLKSHMLIHKDITEVEMYKCSMCTFQTKHKGNIGKHMLIHKDIAEVELYKCSLCTYETKQKSNFARHTLIHKDITEVEMYKCSICTYETKHKERLVKHMLVHKDITEVKMYKCSICTYETKYKRALSTHMLIHKDTTEVKIYKCPMCTYQVKKKTNLTGHMLIHKNCGYVPESADSTQFSSSTVQITE